MNNVIIDRLNALRSEMATKDIDAVYIPKTDPHQSEYLADHWEVLRFLGGFTGSAGSMVITRDSAALWVDSRYFLQAAMQIEGTTIQLMKIAMPGTPSIDEYLVSVLKPGSRVGVDGMLLPVIECDRLAGILSQHGITLDTDFDVIDKIWTDRPALPKGKVFVLPVTLTGRSAKDKIAAIIEDAKRQNARSAFISPLDEIAWTLNIRCNDVDFNPVATAYLHVTSPLSVLFIDKDKLDQPTVEYLAAEGVEVKGYDEVKEYIASLPADDKVLVEAKCTSTTLRNLLGQRAVFGTSPVALPKGIKNDVEIEGFRRAMVRDGVAMVKAFAELDRMLAAGETVTELTVDRLLHDYRSKQDRYFDESFATIAAYGPHGAIVHYEPTAETDVELQPHGLLLVDSGAQYYDGTTDITRTVCLGIPTQQEKHDFTLVMKGHIALDRMVFPVGTHGVQIDAEARKYLWREGLTYLHGTGHGVGHFLNVHEGPQTIRLNYTPVPMMEGMVTSNEPGLYRENVHGVRCENLVLCVKAMSTGFGDFLKFETLTLFPFDISLFETAIMDDDEIAWVNDYHNKVRDALSPYLDDHERAWLEAKTQPIGK